MLWVQRPSRFSVGHKMKRMRILIRFLRSNEIAIDFNFSFKIHIHFCWCFVFVADPTAREMKGLG